ncbi:hypothetical protein TELCIR_02372, partial [Teladorsagia circumcincta]
MTYSYEFLKVETVSEYVISVKLNRPKQLNALNAKIWSEIEEVFKKLDVDEDCRVIILSDGGLMDLVTLQDGEDIARKARQIRRKILEMQQAFTNIEK